MLLLFFLSPSQSEVFLFVCFCYVYHLYTLQNCDWLGLILIKLICIINLHLKKDQESKKWMKKVSNVIEELMWVEFIPFLLYQTFQGKHIPATGKQRIDNKSQRNEKG